MKKSILFVAFLSISLGMIGCKKQNIQPSNSGSGESQVTGETVAFPKLHIIGQPEDDLSGKVKYDRKVHEVEPAGLSDRARLVPEKSTSTAIDVGQYKSYFVLNNPELDKWEDGTSEPYEVYWEIEKCNPGDVILDSYIDYNGSQIRGNAATVILPPKQQEVQLKYFVKYFGEETFEELNGVTYSITAPIEPVSLVGDKILVKKDAVIVQLNAFYEGNFTIKSSCEVLFKFGAKQSVTIDKDCTEESHDNAINYGVDFFGFYRSGAEISDSTEDDYIFATGSADGIQVNKSIHELHKVIIGYADKGDVNTIQVYCSKTKDTFIGQTGDVTLTITNIATETYPQENGEIVFDFAEKLSEFDGSSYYVKFWTWVKDVNTPMRIDSFTIEYRE